jgi:hypothetical protein
MQRRKVQSQVEQTTTTSEDIDSEEYDTPDNNKWPDGIMYFKQRSRAHPKTFDELVSSD